MYGMKMEDVHCSSKQRMVIHKSDYGDFKNNGRFDNKTKIDQKCSQLTNCQVQSLCGGKKSCQLTVNNNLLPSQYCPDTSKEIYTEYTCVDEKFNPRTVNISKGKIHFYFVDD